jgi:hypothetical protein
VAVAQPATRATMKRQHATRRIMTPTKPQNVVTKS